MLHKDIPQTSLVIVTDAKPCQIKEKKSHFTEFITATNDIVGIIRG